MNHTSRSTVVFPNLSWIHLTLGVCAYFLAVRRDAFLLAIDACEAIRIIAADVLCLGGRGPGAATGASVNRHKSRADRLNMIFGI